MSTCTGPGCAAPAVVAIRTTRNSRDIYSTVYYTPSLAPRMAQPYCESCGARLLAELVHLLGEE